MGVLTRLGAAVLATVAVVWLLAGGGAAQDRSASVADVDVSGYPEVVVTVVLDGDLVGVDPADVALDVVEGLTAQAATVDPVDAATWDVTYTSEAAGPTAVLIRFGLDGELVTAGTEIVLPDRGAATSATTASGGASATIGAVTAATSAGDGVVTSTLVIPGDEGVGDELVFWLGIAALAGALLLAGLIVLVPAAVRLRLAPPSRGTGRSILDSLTSRATGSAQRFADRRAGFLARRLEDAGVSMSSGEFIVASIGVGFAALVGATLLSNLFGGLVMAALVVGGAWMWLGHLVDKRQKAFAAQLPETLQLLASNLRVGHGTVQSLKNVADETADPTAEELHRVLTEQRLGIELDESLAAMAIRIDSDEFRWVAQAIAINRQLGGDLAEVLDNVTETITDREHIRAKIRALSADGRLSAYVLIALPFGVAVLLALLNPGYLDELWNRSAGRLVLGCAAALVLAGWLWMRRIIRLVF